MIAHYMFCFPDCNAYKVSLPQHLKDNVKDTFFISLWVNQFLIYRVGSHASLRKADVVVGFVSGII